MSTRVMVTLPDDVYHRAAHLAQLASRDVADLLAEAIILSLPPLTALPASVRAVSEMSDKEVLALTALRMASERDRRLSTLLHKQQAGDLSEPERSELLALMQCYQEGLLRKAQALHEAVRRGLRAPLEP
jgi:hypothetical protein